MRPRQRPATSVTCKSRRCAATGRPSVARVSPPAGLIEGPSARKALRMTATSIASWIRAPAQGQVAEGRDDHADAPTSHAGIDALQRNAPGAPCDRDGGQHAIELIDEQHDVGGLGEAAAPARPWRCRVGRRERRGVVDAVADHHDRAVLPLGQHGPRPSGPASARHARRRWRGRPRRLGDLAAVAGGQHDPLDPERSAGPSSAAVPPAARRQARCARQPAVDGNGNRRPHRRLRRPSAQQSGPPSL